MASTNAIWQQAAHATSTLNCSTSAIQKAYHLTKNTEEFSRNETGFQKWQDKKSGSPS